jgi:ATP-dependent protease La (LON) substrate-binding domain
MSEATEAFGSALGAMPVFPLPGVVLFPGALLPLHVFEPRYRAMLADSLASHRFMAMAFVLGEGDVRDREVGPRVARVAGAGVLTEIESPVSAVEKTGLLAAASAVATAGRKTDFELPAGIPVGAAADLCAHYLVEDAQARQETLEELDVGARVRFVTLKLAEQMGRTKRESRGKPD